jgi:hypothetical protein
MTEASQFVAGVDGKAFAARAAFRQAAEHERRLATSPDRALPRAIESAAACPDPSEGLRTRSPARGTASRDA